MGPKLKQNRSAWKVLIFRDGTQFGSMGPYLGPLAEGDAKADAREILADSGPGVTAKVVRTAWDPGARARLMAQHQMGMLTRNRAYPGLGSSLAANWPADAPLADDEKLAFLRSSDAQGLLRLYRTRRTQVASSHRASRQVSDYVLGDINAVLQVMAERLGMRGTEDDIVAAFRASPAGPNGAGGNGFATPYAHELERNPGGYTGYASTATRSYLEPAGRTRKFDGKTYGLWSRVLYKSMAEAVARRLREEDGRSARVTKEVGEYTVWRGPKLKRTRNPPPPELKEYQLEVEGPPVVAESLAEQLREAIERTSDLCEITPPVCTDNLGIPRSDMPQFSDAVAMKFVDSLDERGDSVFHTAIPVGLLKATQKEINAEKTLNMLESYRRGTFPKIDAPVIVSNDNYILDGHHRWSALIVDDPANMMQVHQVNIPICNLLTAANAFPGVTQRGFGEALGPRAENPRPHGSGIIYSLSDFNKLVKEGAEPLSLSPSSGYFHGGENIYFRDVYDREYMFKVSEFSPRALAKMARSIEDLEYRDGDLFDGGAWAGPSERTKWADYMIARQRLIKRCEDIPPALPRPNPMDTIWGDTIENLPVGSVVTGGTSSKYVALKVRPEAWNVHFRDDLTPILEGRDVRGVDEGKFFGDFESGYARRLFPELVIRRIGWDSETTDYFRNPPLRQNTHLKLDEEAKLSERGMAALYRPPWNQHAPHWRGVVIEVYDHGYTMDDGSGIYGFFDDSHVVSADSSTRRWPGDRYQGIDPLENPDWKALAKKAKELAESAVSAGKEGATRIKEEAQLVGAKARIAKIKSELGSLEKCAKSLGNVHRPAIPERYEVEEVEGKIHLVPGITEFSLMGGLPQDYTPGKKEGYEGLFEKREQLVDAETTLAQIKEAVAKARKVRA